MMRRAMIFVDGENLAIRYQSMIDEEYTPVSDLIHIPDAYVWHSQISNFRAWNLIRVVYYTSIVGDDKKIFEMSKELSKIKFEFMRPTKLFDYGYIVPVVFKKPSKIQKTASVDINITIDILRHTYSDSIDEVLLLTGDGDYIPLIQEVMRQGKIVYVGAFSNGLHKLIPNTADEFIDLDKIFFKS